ncbi:class I SAM-dependent methyltransferase [Dendrosporobacter sp. 1207_IL3150]|uniref:class I SAM-dependent methyltransferase n=1 Tax=Dendrosporobacter sp. 1207_IL3150 TaxID=3084054 RepID=UPI002FDB1F2B
MQKCSVVNIAHSLMQFRLSTALNIVDATAGNGKDTLFLAKNSCEDAVVFSFDIQQEAIHNTEILLKKHRLDYKVRLILDNHANLSNYIKAPIDAAVFNLGYLPGGNHEFTTNTTSTMTAMKQVVERLALGGMVSIIAYPGHSAGFEEHTVLRQYLSDLPSSIYTVGCWEMINHVKSPPVLYLIEKVRSEAREGCTAY